jgi:hypothetical protein
MDILSDLSGSKANRVPAPRLHFIPRTLHFTHEHAYSIGPQTGIDFRKTEGSIVQ